MVPVLKSGSAGMNFDAAPSQSYCTVLFSADAVLFDSAVYVGRTVMSQWMGESSVHELYTAACGLYMGWLVCRVLAVLFSWVPLGLTGVGKRFLEWMLLVGATV